MTTEMTVKKRKIRTMRMTTKRKNPKRRKKDTTHSNGKRAGEDTNEENTMDVMDQGDEDEEEEEEEEEDLNNQQKAKYSLRERKPPIQRLPLYGRKSLCVDSIRHVFPEQPRRRRKAIFYDDDEDWRVTRSSRSRPKRFAAQQIRSKGETFIFRRRVSAHVFSSSTSDSSSDSEAMMPMTNGELNSRPERTARLAKSTALKRMRYDRWSNHISSTLFSSRCVPTNLDLLSAYTGAKKPSVRASTNAGSGVGALNLELNSKSRRANNVPVSLADAESIEIDRTVCVHHHSETKRNVLRRCCLDQLRRYRWSRSNHSLVERNDRSSISLSGTVSPLQNQTTA